jgi:TIR domain-containing protein
LPAHHVLRKLPLQYRAQGPRDAQGSPGSARSHSRRPRWRAVAIRIERLSAEYVASHDQAFLVEAARLRRPLPLSMNDVFVSYARPDRPLAERLAAILERRGWSVWWDRKLLGGDAFSQEIEKALDESRCVIVLWSSSSVGSAWVNNEAAEGAKRHVLLPIQIDRAAIPLGFRHLHALPLNLAHDLSQRDANELFAAVDRILSRAPATERDEGQRSYRTATAPQRSSGLTHTARLRWAMYIAVSAALIVGLASYVRSRALQTRDVPQSSVDATRPSEPIPDGTAPRTPPVPGPSRPEGSKNPSVTATVSNEGTIQATLSNGKVFLLRVGRLTETKADVLVRFTDEHGAGRDEQVDADLRDQAGRSFEESIHRALESLPGGQVANGSSFGFPLEKGVPGQSVCNTILPADKSDPDFSVRVARAY